MAVSLLDINTAIQHTMDTCHGQASDADMVHVHALLRARWAHPDYAAWKQDEMRASLGDVLYTAWVLERGNDPLLDAVVSPPLPGGGGGTVTLYFARSPAYAVALLPPPSLMPRQRSARHLWALARSRCDFDTTAAMAWLVGFLWHWRGRDKSRGADAPFNVGAIARVIDAL